MVTRQIFMQMTSGVRIYNLSFVTYCPYLDDKYALYLPFLLVNNVLSAVQRKEVLV